MSSSVNATKALLVGAVSLSAVTGVNGKLEATAEYSENDCKDTMKKDLGTLSREDEEAALKCLHAELLKEKTK
jgi:hypothetical protein